MKLLGDDTLSQPIDPLNYLRLVTYNICVCNLRWPPKKTKISYFNTPNSLKRLMATKQNSNTIIRLTGGF